LTNLPVGVRNIRTEPMTFGERIRELRQGKHLTLRDLAADVNVTFTYLSKIENQKLSYGEFPSEEMILKLAKALEADPDELMLLAEKIPDAIRQRVLERPEVFRKMATLDDTRLDQVVEFLDSTKRKSTS
jgi:transcriptional regulator with XRE-family HTH domain